MLSKSYSKKQFSHSKRNEIVRTTTQQVLTMTLWTLPTIRLVHSLPMSLVAIFKGQIIIVVTMITIVLTAMVIVSGLEDMAHAPNLSEMIFSGWISRLVLVAIKFIERPRMEILNLSAVFSAMAGSLTRIVWH